MRRYSEAEREYLTKKLYSEVKDCLHRYGVKKTSVDELVARINIPKGTFYLFYPSKEDLLYRVICDYKMELAEKCQQEIANEKNLTCDSFTKIMFNCFNEAQNSFLFQVAENNELEYIMRKLPNEIVNENENQIKSINERIVRFLPIEDKKQLQDLLASFELLFYSSIQKKDMGEQLYYGALWYLLSGISHKIFDRSTYNGT